MHKQEVPGPGWRDAEEQAKKEMTKTSLGSGGLCLTISHLLPDWIIKKLN